MIFILKNKRLKIISKKVLVLVNDFAFYRTNFQVFELGKLKLL